MQPGFLLKIKFQKGKMFGKAPSGRPPVGFSGSGALSHVYIQHPPLRCNIPETQGLYYDDGNKLLLCPTSDRVLSWKTSPIQLEPPSSDSISEGPVLCIRYSLDRKVIGIQRSNHVIEFRNRETGEIFSRRCKPDAETILGFFWTDCPSCDIIFIKTSGIDLFSYESELNTLRLVDAKRFSVSWYVYTHESRMLLLASGMQCTIFSGFQFSSGGIIRLPKFEMTVGKLEANQKPVLAEEDVHTVTVYGRIYCLQLDRAGMLLNVYRFYRDAVVQQGTLPVYSSRIAVSVVDNVLLVHQVDAKVVIIYDIFLDSLSPISAPLPLLLRGKSSNNRQTGPVEDNLTNAYGGIMYGASWTFLVPDLICDIDNGLLWKICLDLEAIAASSSDIPAVLEFLQRRKSDPSTIKSLCLSIMRTVILERRPISMISRAIDVLVASYSHSVKSGVALQEGERTLDMDQHSDVQHISSSGVVYEETRSAMVNRERSVRQESSSGPETEARQYNDRDERNQPHHATTSANIRTGSSVSESDGDANEETVMLNSGESPQKSSIGDMSTSKTGEVVNKTIQTSDTNLSQTPLQSEALAHNGSPSNPTDRGPSFSTVVISPDEMYHFLFAPVEDEMGGDPAYLVAVILEFFRSLSKGKFKVHPNMYMMTIQLLVRNNRYSELGLFVINKIIEPSKEVAFQLLDSGRQDAETRKLGVDMLRQLSLHHDYVTVLLQDGYYLEALRYARKQKVITVQPSLFLEAAVAANSTPHLAAVLRFFSDLTPGFKGTADHGRYQLILAEMNQS